MKKSFSLVELVIVAAVLGILAVITLPILQGHVQRSKESAAKNNLRILRNAIEFYASRHNGITPGYTATGSVSAQVFDMEMTDGGCIPKIPENPFNEMQSVQMIADGDAFPTAATGAEGWIYKPQTKDIRLDWPGTDSTGVAYFDY